MQPWPPTWWPVSSTSVEHQALCSVKWAWSHVHLLWVTPLNRKGKIQGKPFAAPLTVTHTFADEGLDAMEKEKIKNNYSRGYTKKKW